MSPWAIDVPGAWSLSKPRVDVSLPGPLLAVCLIPKRTVSVARSTKKENRHFCGVLTSSTTKSPCAVLWCFYSMQAHDSTLSLRGFRCCLEVQECPPSTHW